MAMPNIGNVDRLVVTVCRKPFYHVTIRARTQFQHGVICAKVPSSFHDAVIIEQVKKSFAGLVKF